VIDESDKMGITKKMLSARETLCPRRVDALLGLSLYKASSIFAPLLILYCLIIVLSAQTLTKIFSDYAF